MNPNSTTKQINSVEEILIHSEINKYNLKKMTYSDIYALYKRNALQPQFQFTMYSALTMLTLPICTNLYYTFRPNGMFAKINPFAVPIMCLAQYIMILRYDLENFCFTDSDDATTMRRKFQTLCKVEMKTSKLTKIQEQIQIMETKKAKIQKNSQKLL